MLHGASRGHTQTLMLRSGMLSPTELVERQVLSD